MSKGKFASVWFSLLANLYNIGRSEIEERERKREARIRSRWIGGLSLATVILSILLGLAVFNWFKAEKAKEAEQKATNTAIKERDNAKRAAAEAEFREAHREYKNGDIPKALVHLAHAVRLDPSWLTSRSLLINLLQHRSWFMPKAILKHQYPVRFAKFSTDGERLLIVSRGTVRLWDTKTSQFLGEPMKHGSVIYSADFNANDTRVLTVSRNDLTQSKTAQLWDAYTGQPVGEEMKHKGFVDEQYAEYTGYEVHSAKFCTNGTRVLTSSGHTGQLWDVNTGQPLGEEIKYKEKYFGSNLNCDGTYAVVNDSTVKFRNVFTGQQYSKPITHEESNVVFPELRNIDFSLDDTRMVTVIKNTAQLWITETNQPVGIPIYPGGLIDYASFSTNGTRIITVSGDNTEIVRLWNADTSAPLGVSMKHGSKVWGASISADNTRVVTASEDGTARIWNASTGHLVGEPMKHGDWVLFANFDNDGTQVVTISKDGGVWLWDAKTGQSIRESVLHTKKDIERQDTYRRYFRMISIDGMRKISITEYPIYSVNGVLSEVYIVDKKRPVRIIQNGRVNSAGFSANDKYVLTVSGDSLNIVRVWDAMTGELFGKEIHLPNTGLNKNFNEFPNQRTGEILAIHSHSDLEQEIFKDAVVLAELSFDSKRLVTVSRKIVKLWDLETGQLVGEPMYHQEGVISVNFSVDNTLLVTTSLHGNVQLWDAVTGKPLSESMEYEIKASSANFNEDGTRMVTVLEDGTTLLWDVLPVYSDKSDLLATLAEAMAGRRLNEFGAIENLEDPAVLLNRLRQQTANAPLGEPTAESFVRWFLSDPWTRTISPLSKKTVPEYIQQEIDAGRREQVAEEFPGHPLLRREKAATTSNQLSEAIAN